MAQTIDPQMVRARRALLDAFDALGSHSESVILVGAQAVYLHTGSAEVALAEFTTDGDLVVDPRHLGDDPLIEEAMTSAGFDHDPVARNPGVWMSADGVQIDLMVPAAVAGNGRRSVDVPPHSPRSMRKSVGLEAALVDNKAQQISALDPFDRRVLEVVVAGPAALLVAKLFKLHERISENRSAENKDAHDIYRILVAISTHELATSLHRLLDHDLSRQVTARALEYLDEDFAAGPQAAGAHMAGAAEADVGEPDQVALAASVLAFDLTEAMKADRP